MLKHLVTFIALTTAAQAGPCGPVKEFRKELQRLHKEMPVAAMLSEDGTIIEVMASEKGKTFTVVRTTPQGEACTLEHGTDFTLVQSDYSTLLPTH